MKIVLVTVGSRGDVQPMVALALALQAAGHRTVLAGPPERAAWARELGCRYTPVGGDVSALLDGFDNVYRMTSAVGFAGKVRRMIIDQFSFLPELIRDADLVVGASLSSALSSVAEAVGVPYRFIAFTPQLIPSALHPCPVFPYQGLPGWLNRLGWRFMLLFDRRYFTRLINQHRRKLNLASLTHAWPHILGDRLIVATDPALGIVPADAPMQVVQTGYMHLQQPEVKLAALDDFLAAGPPPLYAGFGSMPCTDQARLFPDLIAAARMAGRRLVLARFWKDVSEADPAGDVFYISRYPHEYLFPQMALVIHHGGAGTTATTALSGVPQIIVPHALDQYYWGHRVHRTGLGPRPIPRARLTAARLAGAMQDVTEHACFAARAIEVQGQIRRLDGAGAAMRALVGGTA